MEIFSDIFEFGISVFIGLLIFAIVFLPLPIGIKVSIKNREKKKIVITSLLTALAIEVLVLSLILIYMNSPLISNNSSNTIIILTTSFLMFFSLIITSPIVLPFVFVYKLKRKKEAGESIIIFAVVLSIIEIVLVLLNVGIFSGFWIRLMS